MKNLKTYPKGFPKILESSDSTQVSWGLHWTTTTSNPRLAKGRPELLPWFPGNKHISILIIAGGAGVGAGVGLGVGVIVFVAVVVRIGLVNISGVIIRVGNVVGAVNVLTHVTLHRVPGTNWQTVPGNSLHFISNPHLLGHLSSSGVLMHLKEHWVNGINWQLSPILYPQSKQLLVQISGVLLLHLKEHRVPGTNWQVSPPNGQSKQSTVQFSGVAVAGVVVTVVVGVVEGVDGGEGISRVHFLK